MRDPFTKPKEPHEIIPAVFIHIPKTAGLMIESVLNLWSLRNPHRVRRNFRNHGQVSFGHQSYKKMLKNGTVSQEFHDLAFKFCIVRNPYDRAVSHYCYARHKHPDLLDPKYSFVEFTDMLGNRRNINIKFRPQYTWIDGLDMNYIGRYENINDEVRYLASVLDVPVRNIPTINSSNHEPYKQFYCEKSKRNVERFYRKDFDIFGYGHDDTLVHGQLLSA